MATHQVTAKPRKPVLVNLSWAGVLLLAPPLLYVLSYLMAVRLSGTTEMAAYRPVEWLIDETPLRRPILVGPTLAERRKCSGQRSAGNWSGGAGLGVADESISV